MVNDALAAGKWMMGAWRPSGGEFGHVNGVCCLRADFANLAGTIDIIGRDLAWDCAVSPYVKDHWKISGEIKNCFESRNATFDAIAGWPALVHGYKDDSLFNHLWQKFGDVYGIAEGNWMGKTS